MVVGCRGAVGGQLLKDLIKVIHHRIPLFLEGLLEQYFDRISCSLVFLCMSPTWSHYKELGLDLVEPLQDQGGPQETEEHDDG